MINIFEKNEIIIEFINGLSRRAIAKKLDIARNTVNKYVNEYLEKKAEIASATDKNQILILQEHMLKAPLRKKSKKRMSAFTKEVEDRFDELIKIDEERERILGPNKQKITAVLLHKTLLNEGFQISETTIRNKFREYKKKHPECFIKQQYDYAQRAEYDFHQLKVKIANDIKVYHMATISLPKSNYIFANLYKNQKNESFLDSLVKFFKHCNGVPQEVVFDNMSNVVKRFLYKGERELTDAIIKVSSYYGFKINLTNAYSGNEKGHVENSGKIIRRDLFSLCYEFSCEEELFQYFNNELEKRNKPFLEEFIKEISYMIPHPTHPYEIGRVIKVTSNRLSLVSIDSNFYSVPDKYVSCKTLEAIVYVNYINIYDQKSNLIATHEKKDGQGNYSIKFSHFIETFFKKPGAIRNSAALKQAPLILQTIFNNYFITEPQKFLYFLLETNAFDDLDLIGVELGILKRKFGPRTNPKYLGPKSTYKYPQTYSSDSLNEICMNQLQHIAQTFNQGENK